VQGYVTISMQEGSRPKQKIISGVPVLLCAFLVVTVTLLILLLSTNTKTAISNKSNSNSFEKKTTASFVKTNNIKKAVPKKRDEKKKVSDSEFIVITNLTERSFDEKAQSKVEEETRRQVSYASEAQQYLATLLGANPGDTVPPLPISSKIEQEAIKAFNNPIPVFDDDTPEIYAEKVLVAQFLQDMKKYVEGGGTARQYLETFYEISDDLAKTRYAAQLLLRDLSRTPDISRDDMLKLFAQLNTELKEKGICTLKVPKYLAE